MLSPPGEFFSVCVPSFVPTACGILQSANSLNLNISVVLSILDFFINREDFCRSLLQSSLQILDTVEVSRPNKFPIVL